MSVTENNTGVVLDDFQIFQWMKKRQLLTQVIADMEICIHIQH